MHSLWHGSLHFGVANHSKSSADNTDVELTRAHTPHRWRSSKSTHRTYYCSSACHAGPPIPSMIGRLDNLSLSQPPMDLKLFSRTCWCCPAQQEHPPHVHAISLVTCVFLPTHVAGAALLGLLVMPYPAQQEHPLHAHATTHVRRVYLPNHACFVPFSWACWRCPTLPSKSTHRTLMQPHMPYASVYPHVHLLWCSPGHAGAALLCPGGASTTNPYSQTRHVPQTTQLELLPVYIPTHVAGAAPGHAGAALT
eukprot:1158215-Pelagomonas_calceolata.AAC.2